MRAVPTPARPDLAADGPRLGRGRPLAWAIGGALVAVATAVVTWRYLFRSPLESLIDLDVYKRAGRDVLAGRGVYGDDPTRLVFTYPPFAALLAVGTAHFTMWPGQFTWSLATVAALTGVVALSFRPLLARVRGQWWPLVLGGLTAVAVASHPMVEHLRMGQVNVFLVLACLADLLVVRARWPRGALVGVATAVKLTPAVFALHLWSAGRRRAASVAAAAFAICTALAFVLVPGDSVDYWTGELWDTGRVAGSVDFTGNQSLLGMLSRVLPDAAARGAWLVLGSVLAVIGLRRARTASLAGDTLTAAGLVGLLAFVLSPISWIHHGVWLVPAVGALVADGRNRTRVVAAAAVTVLLALRLPWWGWALIDHGLVERGIGAVLHNAYALVAVTLLLVLPVGEGAASGYRREEMARSTTHAFRAPGTRARPENTS